MINTKDHLISEDTNILEAIEKVNRLDHTFTLFVVNTNNQLIGTLTDGDIRRGFLNGLTLEDSVIKFSSQYFHSITNNFSVSYIKELKNNGIRLLPVLNDRGEIIKIYDLNKLKSVLPLSAVIMAGGKGERLRPLTDTIPKPLIKIGKKPIIEHTIDRLIEFGIENFYISVNYLKEQIMEYFGEGSSKNINIQYLEEDEPLGTAGSLSLINDLNEDIILTNSDLLTNIDYEDLYFSFHNKKADMAIASIPYTIDVPYAILNVNGGNINSFREKPTYTYYANAGIYLIGRELIKSVPKNHFFNITDLMQNLIDEQKTLVHSPIVGYWVDIGKIEDLKKAKEIFKHL